jgi:methylthioribose-1-phosphate isomerase
MKDYLPIKFKDHELYLLDQRVLPHEEIFVRNKTIEDVHDSIKNMVVRGAPSIGFTAIFGLAIWIKANPDFTLDQLRKAGKYLKSSRPTAVNLAFEVDRSIEYVAKLQSEEVYDIYSEVVNYGNQQLENSQATNLKMAKAAKKELEEVLNKKSYSLMTHCNTGFLACGSMGTALGVIEYLGEISLVKNVYVDETRPYLQGSRLTSYELTKLKINHEIVVEGAASFLMSQGKVDAIFVGADRIASNGDTANKIGTFNLAIIAKNFNVPFYVVAPLSSFDPKIKTGKEIEIELRPEEEILNFGEHKIAPRGAHAYNPSFDVTANEFITGIICEKGVLKAPFTDAIKKCFE